MEEKDTSTFCVVRYTGGDLEGTKHYRLYSNPKKDFLYELGENEEFVATGLTSSEARQLVRSERESQIVDLLVKDAFDEEGKFNITKALLNLGYVAIELV